MLKAKTEFNRLIQVMFLGFGLIAFNSVFEGYFGLAASSYLLFIETVAVVVYATINFEKKPMEAME